MEQKRAIRSGVTASVVVHVLVLTLILISTEVHPHRSAAEPIAVDIVTPTEVASAAPKPEHEQKQPPLPDSSVFSQKVPASSPLQDAEPQPKASQGASSPRPESQKQASLHQATTPAATSVSSPPIKPPEPDVTVKYNVMLGLPAEQPTPPEKPAKSEEGFEGNAAAANLKSSVIAEFKRHLKTCSKLPDSVASSDHLVVKLRVFMRQDGRLAGEPAIGGGSANIKAINLLQSAIAALKECQPYTMLPVDRYGEWRVLDLDFTPKDFLG